MCIQSVQMVIFMFIIHGLYLDCLQIKFGNHIEGLCTQPAQSVRESKRNE